MTPAEMRQRVHGYDPRDRKNTPNYNPHGAQVEIREDFGRVKHKLVKARTPQQCPCCNSIAEVHVVALRGDEPSLYDKPHEREWWHIECPQGCMGVEAANFTNAIEEWNCLDTFGGQPSMHPHGTYPVGHAGWPLLAGNDETSVFTHSQLQHALSHGRKVDPVCPHRTNALNNTK